MAAISDKPGQLQLLFFFLLFEGVVYQHRFWDQQPRNAYYSCYHQPELHGSLVRVHLQLYLAEFQRHVDESGNDGRCCIRPQPPIREPLQDNECVHVAKQHPEKYQLRSELQKEIYRAAKEYCVEGLGQQSE